MPPIRNIDLLRGVYPLLGYLEWPYLHDSRTDIRTSCLKGRTARRNLTSPPSVLMSLFKWILCAIALVAASPAAYSRAIPNGWSLHRRADPNTLVPLKFKLAQSNIHNLDAYLLDIADPSSPNYGKHWTPSQVAQTFRPSQATIDAVHAWLLTEHGLEPHRIVLTESGGTLRVDATAAEAERILGAEYNVYQHAASGRERVGCHEGYALPEHVSKHVDFVSPTVHFGASRVSGVGSSLKKRGKGPVSIVGHEGGAQGTPIAVSVDSGDGR